MPFVVCFARSSNLFDKPSNADIEKELVKKKKGESLQMQIASGASAVRKDAHVSTERRRLCASSW